jgi:putative tryptophan/tyrosine transport system substrate-binding protein
MKRRQFLGLLGGAAAWPLAVQAQGAMATIGILSGTNREPRLIDAVLAGLQQAGYAEGRNLAIEYRFAEGNFDRLKALAADLVQRNVSAIVAMQSATAPQAAKAASSTIPVVFSIGGDPVRLGLVESLNRPGGNVTGATFLVNSLGAKRLEVLRDLLPGAKVIGLLVNPRNPAAPSEKSDVEAAARALGLQLHIENASNPGEIDAAFDRFKQQQVQGVTFAADATFNAGRKRIIALAARHALPTIYFYRAFAEDGGLITYGGFDTDAYHLAGTYAGRILQGEKPADLPVQQSIRVELVINLKTAAALGIQVPLTLTGRADEVIE